MPIDTAQKRRSAYAMTLPAPDAAITQPDRQHVLWMYPGILAAVPALVIVFGQLFQFFRPAVNLFLRRPRHG